MASANFTPAEEKQMASDLGEGRHPTCPRCGAGMDRREVPPRDGVPYVRDRIWLVCRGCRRSAVFDRRRVEGG